MRTDAWDSAAHLETPEDIAAYIDAAIEGPAFLNHAHGVVAKAQGMGKIAEAVGGGREGLYKSLSENGNPSFATVQKVTSALGLRLGVVPT